MRRHLLIPIRLVPAFMFPLLCSSVTYAHIVDMSACDCSPPNDNGPFHCEAVNSAPELLFAGTPKTAYAQVCMQNCSEGCPENGPNNDPDTTAQLCLTISATEGAEIGSEISAKIGGGPVPTEISSTLTSALSSQSTFECATCQTVGLGEDNSCTWAKKYMSQQIKQGVAYTVETEVSHCDNGGSVCRVCWTDTSTIVGDVCVGQLSQGTLESGTCDDGANHPCPTSPPS